MAPAGAGGVAHVRADDGEPWWKLRAFRNTGDALVIWTDDEIPDDALGIPGVLRTSPATGLTPDDLGRILDVLEFAHGSQGLDVRLGRR